jgi:hypothetical protein
VAATQGKARGLTTDTVVWSRTDDHRVCGIESLPRPSTIPPTRRSSPLPAAGSPSGAGNCRSTLTTSPTELRRARREHRSDDRPPRGRLTGRRGGSFVIVACRSAKRAFSFFRGARRPRAERRATTVASLSAPTWWSSPAIGVMSPTSGPSPVPILPVAQIRPRSTQKKRESGDFAL